MNDSVNARYFNVGTTKLLAMSISTFGIYLIFWLYKNWKAEGGLPLAGPWFLALFSPIFIYPLAVRVHDRAVESGVPAVMPLPVAIGFILLYLAGFLPEPWFLLAALQGVPLVPLQSVISRINAARGLGLGPEAKWTVANVVWLVIGAILWLLVLIGLSVEVEPSPRRSFAGVSRVTSTTLVPHLSR